MLPKYENNSLVGEILIINNNKSKFLEDYISGFSKIKLLGDGINMYVNPSWNYAVEESKYDKLIIVNDDIYIDKFDKVVELLEANLVDGGIIGFSKNCFMGSKTIEFTDPCIVKENNYTLTHGFGTFMVLNKKDYLTIEEPMLIWYGDMYLYAQLNPFVINGITIETPMQTTTSKLNLNIQRRIEKSYFLQHPYLFTKLRGNNG
jgi:hypothetical protein